MTMVKTAYKNVCFKTSANSGETYNTWLFIVVHIHFSLLCTALHCTEIMKMTSLSDYRLDDWGSIPGRGKGFFL
jgi:hypothetical protein